MNVRKNYKQSRNIGYNHQSQQSGAATGPASRTGNRVSLGSAVQLKLDNSDGNRGVSVKTSNSINFDGKKLMLEPGPSGGII